MNPSISTELRTLVPTRSKEEDLHYLDRVKNVTLTIKSILESISGIFLILYSLQSNTVKSLSSHKHLNCSNRCLIGSVENPKIHAFICNELQSKLLNKITHYPSSSSNTTTRVIQDDEEARIDEEDQSDELSNDLTKRVEEEIQQLDRMVFLTEEDLTKIEQWMSDYIQTQFRKSLSYSSTIPQTITSLSVATTSSNNMQLDEW